jgi:N-acetylglucosaminyl-diphospho-decaprenol L-rhamnosyltransferase
MSTQAPVDVTVSIVAHGNRDLVLGCIRSLVADSSRSRSIEIIVLDNASEDGTADAIRGSFPNVLVLERHERAGFGANHNLVASQARGKYLFVLNDDTVVAPGSVDALAGYLDEHHEVGTVGARIRSSDGKVETFVLRFPDLIGALRYAIQPWRPLEPRWDGLRPRRVDWVTGCAMMIRSAAFAKANGFDEGFFMYAEDKDLCLRLARLGWQTHLSPAAEVVHFGAASTQKAAERPDNEFWRSQRRYYRKHLSPLTARLALLLTAVGAAELWLAAALLTRLPRIFRPRRMRRNAAGEYFRQARGALRGESGPGLRELAEDWNRRSRDRES